jgi:DNA polymerase
MEQIISDIKKCEKCELCKTRTQAVPGDGNLKAEIIIVGEAPGKNEDIKGVPFVGRAGKILDEMLLKIGLERKDIYITNIVKCRPPENRDPTPNEKKICSEHLDKQIEKMKPKVIVSLGRHSGKYLFEKYGLEFPGIGEAHGKSFKTESGLVLFPIYHPAAAIYNQKLKKDLEEDFQNLIKILKKPAKTGLLKDYF